MSKRFIGRITFAILGDFKEKNLQVIGNSFLETLQLLWARAGAIEVKYGRDAVVYLKSFVEPFVFESEIDNNLVEMRNSMTQQQFENAYLVKPRVDGESK